MPHYKKHAILTYTEVTELNALQLKNTQECTKNASQKILQHIIQNGAMEIWVVLKLDSLNAAVQIKAEPTSNVWSNQKPGIDIDVKQQGSLSCRTEPVEFW